jgi:hypothetical protein
MIRRAKLTERDHVGKLSAAQCCCSKRKKHGCRTGRALAEKILRSAPFFLRVVGEAAAESFIIDRETSGVLSGQQNRIRRQAWPSTE